MATKNTNVEATTTEKVVIPAKYKANETYKPVLLKKYTDEIAPKLDQFMINPDKIREVIGQGGKMINEIIAKCDNVKIDISDDGRVVIYHQDREAINKAKDMIQEIAKEAHVGEIYNATVVRMESFGVFVNLFKGCDALLHVSQIKHERINHPKDVLKINDVVKVIVTEIDEKGRVNVSAKDLLPKPEKKDNKENKETK